MTGHLEREKSSVDVDGGELSVAVIGMSCRFPGADSPLAFWRNLVAGRESISRPAASPASGKHARRYVRAAGILDNIQSFDYEYFKMPRREAERTDPQHRLFLQCALESLQDAGYDQRTCPLTIGVFAGSGPSDYGRLVGETDDGVAYGRIESIGDLQGLIGNYCDFLSSQTAYRLDLTGPAISVQAACATGLVAVHLACTSILCGDCDAAIAGAAWVRVPQPDGHFYEPGMVFSEDGLCRPFDGNATGTVFGNGVGTLLLRRLDHAVRDRDPIYCVIKGSAINNDGNAKLGFSAPAIAGQRSVIRRAIDASGINPRAIGFVEGHGTGTPIGDEVEISALRDAWSEGEPGECVLGSVKANIGHLGWASGIAGFIKAALALKHGRIPPTLNFSRPSRALAESCFIVASEGLNFPVRNGPRVAAVSAFGLGGTNAHVILEEAPASLRRRELRRRLFLFSAADRDGLATCVERHIAALQENDCVHTDDLAFTVAQRPLLRFAFSCHAADAQELSSKLAAGLGQHLPDRLPTSGPPKVAFLFSGQGDHRPGACAELYRELRPFARAIDECGELLEPLAGLSLKELLFGSDSRYLLDVRFSHAALLAVQYALFRSLSSWGIYPDFVCGHSAGEYGAACAAGVFSIEQALKVVLKRGELFAMLPTGFSAVSIMASRDEVAARLLEFGDGLEISAVNGALSTVVSGRRESVMRLQALLCRDGIQHTPLDLPAPSHTRHVEVILPELMARVRELSPGAPLYSFVSSLDGELKSGTLDEQFWCAQTRQPVRFDLAMNALARQGANLFVEFGPASQLTAMAAGCRTVAGARFVSLVSRGPNDSEHGRFLDAMGALWKAGAEVDWPAFYEDEGVRRIHAPLAPPRSIRCGSAAPADGSPAVSRSSRRGTDGTMPAARDGLFALEWRKAGEPDSPGAAFANTLILGDSDALWPGGILANRGQISRGSLPRTPEDIQRSLREHPELDQLVYVVPQSVSQQAGASTVCRTLLPVLDLIRAIAAHPRPVALTLVSCSATAGGGEGGLAAAAISGLIRCARIEHPELALRCLELVDLSSHAREATERELLYPGEEYIRLGQGGRMAPRLLRTTGESPRRPHFLESDTVLITGGFGEIGSVLTGYLVERGARHLAVLGRKRPGPAWRSAAERWRGRGVHVSEHAADVSDIDALSAVVLQLTTLHPPVSAIFHLAGSLADATVSRLTATQLSLVLRPKVEGALNLARLSGCLPIRHFVFFSSIVSVLGNAGQASHAAANACLDRLAEERGKVGLPALSINWGAWSEAGRLAHDALLRVRVERAGFRAVSNAQAVDALDAALAFHGHQLCAAPIDVARIQQRAGGSLRVIQELCSSEETTASRSAKTEAATPGDRESDLTSVLEEALTSVFGDCSPFVENHALDFFEGGMDSLSAIELRNALQQRLRRSLPPTLAYKHPSFEKLLGALVLQPSPALPDTSGWASDVTVQPSADGPVREISLQQQRWLRLLAKDYGRLLCPVVFHCAYAETAFRAALQAVLERHEVLRWRFLGGRAEVMTCASAMPAIDGFSRDLRGFDTANLAKELERLAADLRSRPPAPEVGPAWSMKIVCLEERRFVALLLVQHLEFDGASIAVFVDDLRRAYKEALRGDSPCDGWDVAPQYREFVTWQKHYLKEGSTPDAAFFEGAYASLEGGTRLPGAGDPRFSTSYPSLRYTPPILSGLFATVQQASGGLGVSPFSFFTAAYARLLGEILRQSRVVIGTIVSGRPAPQFARTIGPFVTPYPMVVACDGTPDGTIRAVHRFVTALNERCGYHCAELTRTIEPFAGYPLETYFTDAYIMLNNYRKESQLIEPKAEVLECLAPGASPLLGALDAPYLNELAGLFLIIDVVESEIRFNFWFHEHRFQMRQVCEWAARYEEVVLEFCRARRQNASAAGDA